MPRVRFTIGRLMAGGALAGIVLGLAFDRLVRQPAKDALRSRIRAHERGAVYWDDLERSSVRAVLSAAGRDAIRGLRDWHRGRGRELGRLDPMRVPSRVLDKDFSEDVRRTLAVMNLVNSEVDRAMPPRSAGEAGSFMPPN